MSYVEEKLCRNLHIMQSVCEKTSTQRDLKQIEIKEGLLVRCLA